ncbi:MAG: ABC transporter ATP-binding protein [Clostridiales bacterium]|nr:ABC transporter ATP-binding protein [Clostridiales bacterium]
MTDITTSIKTSDLSRRFGKTMALDGLSFSIKENQIVGLLGRNGAGKSTLLRILSGQLKQTSGDIELFGMPVYDNAQALSNLCMIGDTPDFGSIKNINQFLPVMAAMFPAWDSALADKLIDRFDLPRKKALKGFSRGMQTSLLLCVGLASGARLTVFDEPSLGLDAVMRERFYDMLIEIRTLQPNRSFVLSTHLIDEVTRTLDYAVMIDHGKLMCQGDMQELTSGYISISGAPDAVREASTGATVLKQEEVAGSLVLHLRLASPGDKEKLMANNSIQCASMNLQRLFVFLTEEEEVQHANNK